MKKIIKILCLILLIIIVIVFSSYAIWQITEKQTNKNIVGTACLDISFTDEINDINLTNMWPTTDEDGESLIPYSFTITNNCDTTVRYHVLLESIEDDTYNNYLNYDYIKIKFNNEYPIIYDDLDDMTNDNETDYDIRDTKLLATRRLAGGESVTHDLRIWLDEDTPMSEMNKYFFSKIKVIGGQNIGEELLDYTPEEYFTVNSNGVLTNYNFAGGNIVIIPPSVNGIPITSIAENAFNGGSAISYLDISDMSYLTTISRSAFYEYKGEDTNLIIPDSVNLVGHRAFRDYNGDSLKLSSNLVTIEPYAFFSYVGTGKDLVLPDTVRTIGDYAFFNFLGNKISFNDGLQTIGSNVFYKYVGTNQELIIPDSVTSIGQSSFSAFNGIKVVLGESLTVISNNLFYSFNGGSLVLNDNIVSFGNASFRNYKGIGTELIFPDTVLSVGDRAFFQYRGNKLDVGDNLVSIDIGAFANYNGVDITLPASLTTINTGSSAPFYMMSGNIIVTASDTSGYESGWAPRANIIYDN